MKKYYFLFLVFLFPVTLGCSSDELYVEEDVQLTKGPVVPGGGGGDGPQGPLSAFDDYKEGQVSLGKDLSNIYSVEAMRGAYNQQYPNGDGQYGPSGIRTTHYYIRFLPKNEDEYDSIVQYDLSEIPLYSEVIKGGSSYHDPSIPANQYTWQYALIPINKFEPTNVQYEILKNMFIVDQGEPGVAGPGGSPSYTFWEKLEIINHKAETGEDIGPGISWTPSGKLEVYDDLLQKYIPLVGVRVIISRNGHEQVVKTDATGSFTSKRTYKTSVYYKIKWASGIEFEIKDGDFSQAYLISKRSFLPFNVKLNNDNLKQKNIATIFRAAQRVYYKNYLNMDRPIVKPWGLPQRPMKIAYHTQKDCPFAGRYELNATSMEGSKPNIIVCNTGSFSNDVFETTIHEFAHAGHHIKFNKYSWTVPKQIIHESWACAVEYYITKLEYADYGKDIDDYVNIMPLGPTTYGAGGSVGAGGINYILPNDVNKQWWPHEGNQSMLLDKLAYSSLVIDLVDNNNQALYYKLKPVSNVSHKTYPNDEVSGFELSKIQTVLGVTGLADFKNKIKQLNSQYYSNKNTSIQIDTLFNRYEHYWNK